MFTILQLSDKMELKRSVIYLKKLLFLLCLLLVFSSCSKNVSKDEPFDSDNITESFATDSPESTDTNVTESFTTASPEPTDTTASNVQPPAERQLKYDDDYKFVTIKMKTISNQEIWGKPIIIDSAEECKDFIAQQKDNVDSLYEYNLIKLPDIFKTGSDITFFDDHFLCAYFCGAREANNPIGIAPDVEFRPTISEITEGYKTISICATDAVVDPDAEYMHVVKLPRKYLDYEISQTMHEAAEPLEVINGFTVQKTVRLFDESDGHVGQFSFGAILYENAEKSIDDLQEFLASNRMGYSWSEAGFDKTAEEICQKYDKDFFENNYLLVITCHMPKTKRCDVVSITSNGKYSMVNISDDPEPADRVAPLVYKQMCIFVELPRDIYGEYIYNTDDFTDVWDLNILD